MPLHNESRDSINAQGGHGQVFNIETLGRGVYAMLVGGVILAALLSGMALTRVEGVRGELEGRVALAEERANKAEREARVMQERWNDLKVELVRRGIPVSDH